MEQRVARSYAQHFQACCPAPSGSVGTGHVRSSAAGVV